MAEQLSSDEYSAGSKNMAGSRAPWATPRVIVSDLGDARADTIIPGGDGVDPVFTSYAYGS
jgi:hypothetical protein